MSTETPGRVSIADTARGNSSVDYWAGTATAPEAGDGRFLGRGPTREGCRF